MSVIGELILLILLLVIAIDISSIAESIKKIANKG